MKKTVNPVILMMEFPLVAPKFTLLEQQLFKIFKEGLTIKYDTGNNNYDELTVPTEIGSRVYPVVSWEVTTTKI